MDRRPIFIHILAAALATAAGTVWSEAPPKQSAISPAKAAATSQAEGSADYDALLRKYVRGDYFAYGELLKNKADLARFNRFLAWQAAAPVASMSREEQIAFYINAYNSCSIKAVLDQYPVHSPKDIDGFFDKLKFQVGGEEITISTIEYDRLIANYKDMRAHFSVVCSDRGCLPLKPGAYTGETLEADLEAAANKFVNDERQFKVDKAKKEIQISKLFEWYGPKFTQDSKRPVAKPELFLTPWVSEDVRQLFESGDYELKIIEWDWTLNEQIKK